MQESKRLPIFWRNLEGTVPGNALGYGTHNSNMKKHCEKYFEYREDAKIALSILPADHWAPTPGKINVLFTMWEYLDLPESYALNINKADLILVPSSFCRDLLKRYTNVPVEVCWEGIDPGKYQFYDRQNKSKKPFKFLWVGAPNPRKGYPLVLEAIKVFENDPNVEIHIKTTVQKIPWKKTLSNIWKKRRQIMYDGEVRVSALRMLSRIPHRKREGKFKRIGKFNNIIWDTRFLPADELASLYYGSHCFLFPTFGEGWGLTLCEAMATGLPCIATPITGCTDFFDERVGVPIAYTIMKQKLENYDLHARGYVPNTVDMVKAMFAVMQHYDRALDLGKKASERVRNKFTWEKSATRLNQIMTKYAEKWGVN